MGIACCYGPCTPTGMLTALNATRLPPSPPNNPFNCCRYCSTACSHADWRQGGHKLVCKALAAERAERKAQAAAGGGSSSGA